MNYNTKFPYKNTEINLIFIWKINILSQLKKSINRTFLKIPFKNLSIEELKLVIIKGIFNKNLQNKRMFFNWKKMILLLIY